ncbi:MAG: PAS domain-containing protein [Elusimicrobia bacterium]|nr:PAS domain-containing protein [Elusimicrobiota bacterium]
MGGQESRPAFRGREALEQWLLACASAVGVYALSRAGLNLSTGPADAAPFWPAAGFALAATALWGPGAAFGVFFGAALAYERPSSAGAGAALVPGLTAMALAGLGAAAQALMGAAVFRRAGSAAFLWAAAALIALVSPGFELLALAAAGAPPGLDWARAAAIWWIGNASGLLVVAPLLLAGARPPPFGARRSAAAPPEFSGRLFDRLPIGLLILRLDEPEKAASLRVVSLNAAGRSLAGAEGARAAGALLSEFSPESFATELPAACVSALKTGESRVLHEFTSRHAPGAYFNVNVFPLGGPEVGVAFENVTERRNEQRRARAQELERRTAELSRSNQELSQFAYVASHDLSAPLHKVKAFGSRLQEKVEGKLDEEGRDYLRRMLRAVDGMQSLIDALLALSRVSTRGAPAEVVDLGALTRDVVESLDHEISRARARVEIGDLPRISADPLQMRQLLQNLLSNAVKFHAPGAAPRVRVSGKATEDGLCELVVSDNGVGFDMKFAERIFQPFQRLQSSAEYQGTGMGLAICRKIVSRHGGTIGAASAPGRGAEFKVVLPVSQEGRMAWQPQEKAFS